MTTAQEAWREFAADWLAGLNAALASLGGAAETFDLKLEPELTQSPSGEESTWFRYRLSEKPGAELAVVCPPEAIQAVGDALLGAEAASADLTLETMREALTQAAAAAAAALGERSGRTLAWAPLEAGKSPEQRPFASAATLLAGTERKRIWLAPSATLVNEICGPGSQAAGVDKKSLADEASDAAGGEEGLELKPHRNLDLLLDLELDLSVSFGRTVLPLDEVVRMTVGSIVQLNRSAADPVDVLVNNSVVARGEVVVIDGNYGVRVTQVASRQERLERML